MMNRSDIHGPLPAIPGPAHLRADIDQHLYKIAHYIIYIIFLKSVFT